MDLIWDGVREAFHLIFSGNRQVFEIALRSVAISATATGIGLAIGAGFGLFLAFRPFYGRTMVVSLLNTGMALPPVVVGLFAAVILPRNGHLGDLGLLYTPGAMVLAQALIVTP